MCHDHAVMGVRLSVPALTLESRWNQTQPEDKVSGRVGTKTFREKGGPRGLFSGPGSGFLSPAAETREDVNVITG